MAHTGRLAQGREFRQAVAIRKDNDARGRSERSCDEAPRVEVVRREGSHGEQWFVNKGDFVGEEGVVPRSSQLVKIVSRASHRIATGGACGRGRLAERRRSNKPAHTAVVKTAK